MILMHTGELIKIEGMRIVRGGPDINIGSVEFDSRKCAPGSLFVAIKGFNSDGHEYITAAAEKGASAVLIDSARDKDLYPARYMTTPKKSSTYWA